MSTAIRVLLVDDHAVVREGLRAFLALQDGIDVVGEAGNGEEAVQLAAQLTPDVVLLDLVMPAGDGLPAIHQLRVTAPKARVLILTSYADDSQIFAATAAGAAGYLLKVVDRGELAAGIREVHAGLPALHPSVSARLMRVAQTSAGAGTLTARER